MISVTTDTHGSLPVLVTVDFSMHSRRALLYAARLAQWVERPLVSLHAVHEGAGSAGIYRAQDTGTALLPLATIAKTLLEDFVERLRATHPELSALEFARTGVVSGIPGSRIAEMAEICSASIVVVGSRGLPSGGRDRFLMPWQGTAAARWSWYATIAPSIAGCQPHL